MPDSEIFRFKYVETEMWLLLLQLISSYSLNLNDGDEIVSIICPLNFTELPYK